METRHPLMDTMDQILRERTPNLLRLHVNPHVAQTCLCLSRYVRTTWQVGAGEWQSFLANCFDEALSGAIKLARYGASVAGKSTAVIVFDPTDRLGPFASANSNSGMVEFLPGVNVVNEDDVVPFGAAIGVLALVPCPDLGKHADAIRTLIERDRPIVIVCVDRTSLTELRRSNDWLPGITPDVVLFDESFVERAVPFSAFTARKDLFDHWNKPGKTTFHSTTYQPNTVSTLHFMRCLAAADAAFHESLASDLARIASAPAEMFRLLYSPSLYRLIRTAGFDGDVLAAGDSVIVDGRPILDAVSGVACSVRGHNPPTYTADLAALPSADECEAELARRLRDLTGLACMVPAVSGATAVENALKLALVAQYPRRHILALKSGFGGKTLLSLTGTANPSYKTHIDPLYADVHYVDPFAADAVAQIEAVLRQHPVAVVQMELIQAVGGVRRVPDNVIRYLETHRQEFGYLLLVDEVQTGMCRTGSFTLSRELGLTPDLLLLGKATSDMMFPFALTLFTQDVHDRLVAAGSNIVEGMRQRYGYEFGYKTVLNVLRLMESLDLPTRVKESGNLCASLLNEGLASCNNVREVRVYGLLIGIELDATRWPQRWFRKKLYSFYLYSMLRHQQFPVLVGFCQYEPNVLKITPALNVRPEQVRSMCATIIDVLHRPFPRLLAAAIGGLIGSIGLWRNSHEHGKPEAHDAVVR
jgi:acetylornithine/succinyldiaminopimelate/putrescine aminotransferase